MKATVIAYEFGNYHLAPEADAVNDAEAEIVRSVDLNDDYVYVLWHKESDYPSLTPVHNSESGDLEARFLQAVNEEVGPCSLYVDRLYTLKDKGLVELDENPLQSEYSYDELYAFETQMIEDDEEAAANLSGKKPFTPEL